MSAAAATYLPDCQVITLKWDFEAFADPENLRGVVGPTEIAVFFHEWLHYLHNVSTDHGLSAFGNQVALWAEFRNTIVGEGLPTGSSTMTPERLEVVRQRLAFLMSARARQQPGIPGLTDVDELRITRVDPVVTPLGDDADASLTVLVCEAEIAQLTGPPERVSIRIGTLEILESLAVMLEGELARRLGGASPPASPVPYQLLLALARSRAPGLSPHEVALCGLASLQVSDPPGVLLGILDLGHAASIAGKDPAAAIARQAAASLAAQSTWEEETLSTIERAFPVDEPLARAVKRTVQMFRTNFSHRRRDPFFEFAIISALAADVRRMDAVIRVHGGCCLIQQRTGDPNQPGRDLMYDFAQEPNDELLAFGLRKMHASFRFVALHCTPTGFIATDEIRTGERTKCPFYTVCAYPIRTSNPEVCAREPWKSDALTGEGPICWYASAVRDMRLPASERSGSGPA